MTTTHSSQACCSTPVPKATAEYTPKGTYTTHASTKCYVTGSPSATKAIFHIYDIFGYRMPTLQGADILAQAGYLVIMPDFFDNDPADPAWLGGSEDGKKAFGAFLGRIGDPGPFITKIHALLPALKESYPSVEKWGSIGFCWGGKIVSLTSAAGATPWSVAIQSSPARVDPEDAKKVGIPMMMLASEGEDAETVRKFGESLKGDKVVERFGDMVHGWMSARATLGEEKGKAEYERGYGMVLEFLEKYM